MAHMRIVASTWRNSEVCEITVIVAISSRSSAGSPSPSPPIMSSEPSSIDSSSSGRGKPAARHELRISQDPRVDASIPLRRSLNETDGMEFSYMMWMFIDDYEYKKGEWKHVFHKGNVEAAPNRAPGVWLHPNENKLRVYMNTFQTISSYVDIGNIPVSKWFHLSIVLKQRTMDIYINGFLKKRVTFDSIPRQNFGDLWVNTRGGFAGFVSRMRYFDYAVNFTEVENALRVGPSMDLPAAATQKPPYLVPHWWSNEYGQ